MTQRRFTFAGNTEPITYFCNPQEEPVYFPDRSLATLLNVNLSTLRGRLNKYVKNHAGGVRVLMSERAKAQLKSIQFRQNEQGIMYLSQESKPSPVHGHVAINHISLVNTALKEWVSFQ